MQIPSLEFIVDIKVDILYADLKFNGLFVVRVTFSVELSPTNHVKITKPKLNRVISPVLLDLFLAYNRGLCSVLSFPIIESLMMMLWLRPLIILLLIGMF